MLGFLFRGVIVAVGLWWRRLGAGSRNRQPSTLIWPACCSASSTPSSGRLPSCSLADDIATLGLFLLVINAEWWPWSLDAAGHAHRRLWSAFWTP